MKITTNKVQSYRSVWLGLIGLIFVIAKVTGLEPVSEWSWWLVLLPFYLMSAIILFIIITVGIVFYFKYFKNK